ncbi:TraB/GumN family protein [Pontibacter sp. KCTC 32443]|uniref:TraB/GumN family protein n=1 Tax=Pontibacter TaxID=323449 RepID=UPI00164DD533|nr:MULTISPECIES: TraB/GumN family protein [Pontibacter]MBC5774162.1 TraB/GumN family protein [Pontibacter sp. KCTC 32443]
MKRSNIHPILLLLLVIVNAVVPALAQEQAPADQPKALLWEITGQGLKQPSYLFGTIHAICPENYFLSPAVKEKLSKAERLSLEVDMDAPNFMAELQQAAVLPSGTTLRSFFSEADYKLLSSHFKQTLEINLDQLERMKPFMLHSMLLSQLTECQAVSYEQSLMEIAQTQGKEVIGLETVGEQLSAIDEMPANVQAAMLTKMINNMEEARQTYRTMVKLYLQQDLSGLDALSRKEYNNEEYHLYEQAFLVNRNKRWIPVMEREARIEPTFFAVGAGHLTGENGLLELLRKRGYTVTPVQ